MCVCVCAFSGIRCSFQLYSRPATSTDVSSGPVEISKSPVSSDNDEEKSKWTPFLPPNMDNILSKMPLVPLTLEQLCAPTSDEEGEEGEEVEEREGRGDNESKKKDDELLNVEKQPANVTTTTDVKTAMLTQNSDSISISSDSGMKVAACSTATYTSAITTGTKTSTVHAGGQPISHFIREHLSDSKKPQKNIGEIQTSNPKFKSVNVGKPKPDTSHSNFIDLTDHEQYPTSPNRPSTSGSRQSHVGNTLSTAEADQFDQQEDEFDVLCLDIDLDTIDDFSDTECEAGPSSHARDFHSGTSSHTFTHSGGRQQMSDDKSLQMVTTCGSSRAKGKSSIRGGSQLTKGIGSASQSSNIGRPSTETLCVTVTTEEENALVSSQPKFTYPSSSIKTKRSHDFDYASSAKRPRLDPTMQQHRATSSSTIDSFVSHKNSTHTSMGATTTTHDGRISTAVPRTATHDGRTSTAVPRTATHDGRTSTAVPRTATHDGRTSTAVPRTATHDGRTSTAVPRTATHDGRTSTTVSITATHDGRTSTAVPRTAAHDGRTSTAVSRTATHDGRTSTAVPRTAAHDGRTSTAVPRTATHDGRTSTSVSRTATHDGRTSTAVPRTATHDGRTSTAVPRTATHDGRTSTAVPRTAAHDGRTSTAVPRTATHDGGTSTSVPRTATHDGRTSTAVPRTATHDGRTSTAVPRTATHDGRTSTAVPRTATHDRRTSTATPRTATHDGRTSIAVPRTATHDGRTSTATPRTATHDGRTSTAVPRTATHDGRTSTTVPRTATHDGGTTTQTSHREAASSSGVGRRTTPLGAQLTTENCPMCNTKFPSW